MVAGSRLWEQEVPGGDSHRAHTVARRSLLHTHLHHILADAEPVGPLYRIRKVPIPIDWSLDGTEIYVSLREGTENPNSSVWAISVIAQGKRQLTLEQESAYPYADLSPDGSLLAVVWCEGRNCDLWVSGDYLRCRV